MMSNILQSFYTMILVLLLNGIDDGPVRTVLNIWFCLVNPPIPFSVHIYEVA